MRLLMAGTVLLAGLLCTDSAFAQDSATDPTVTATQSTKVRLRWVAPTSRSATEAVAELEDRTCATSNNTGFLINQGQLQVALAARRLGDPTAFGYPSSELVQAARCLRRALWLSPDNYHATFLFGVTRTLQAFIENDAEAGDERARALFVASAKKSLGRAYVLRTGGSAEVLYYLAELALVENQTDTAVAFLQAILATPGGRVKYRGASHALMGFIYEEADEDQKAIESYRAAVDQGWPPEVFRFAIEKLLKEDR